MSGVEVSMKLSPKQAGKLYMKCCGLEDRLKAANEAMEKAKTAKGWDSMPHAIHVHLDELFKAISA